METDGMSGTRRILLGASILSADFLNLGSQIHEAERAGIDFVHFDVMDGRFVPNLSMGLPVLEAVRSATRLPIDAHLMMVEPERWVERFAEAGADTITVHVETCNHLHRTLLAIAEAGAEPSVTLNPGTPLALLEEVVPIVRQILVMTVNPGFGGQTFMPAMLDKIRRLRKVLNDRNPTCRLEIDGGIKPGNVGRAVEAGADTIVIGSALFEPSRTIEETLSVLRSAANTTPRPPLTDAHDRGE